MILFHATVQFWLNTVVRNKGNRLSLYRTSGKHLRDNRLACQGTGHGE